MRAKPEVDGNYMSIRWFVGSGPGADIDHRPGLAQGRVDQRAKAWIFTAGAGIVLSNRIVTNHKGAQVVGWGWPTSSSAHRTRVSRASPLPPSGDRSNAVIVMVIKGIYVRTS